MKKRFLAMLLLAALVLAVMPGVHASGALFFVGVNNNIPLMLPGETSPFYASGALYAPYTVFEAAPAGISISYDVEQELLVLFTMGNTVVYDLAEGTMKDKDGSTSEVELIYRNGVLYLPVERAARQFGLTVSLNTSATGCSLLRFKDGTEIYDDATFLEKSERLIADMLDSYGEHGSAVIGGEVQPEPTEEEEEETDGSASVYLVFVADAVSQSTLGDLEALEYVAGTRVHAAFFLTREQILETPDLVRRIYSGGYTLGLTVEAGEPDAEAALRSANDALDTVLFCRSVLALLPDDAPQMESYRIFRQSQTVQSVEEVLEQTETAQMLVCRGDSAGTLGALSANGAVLLQLLETSSLPEKSESDE